MRAGKLRNLVTIQRPVSSANDEETIDAGWVDVCQAWADIRYINGLETIRSGVPISVARASIRIRFRDDVVANMRVVHQSAIYDIKAVQPDIEKRSFVDLIVETGQNLG